MSDVVGLRFVAEGEREAVQALRRFDEAKKRLTRSILDGASRVQSASSAWQRANQLYREGVISANALRTAQTQVARELAVLNGYITSNGRLNTNRALAELRAAEAARENARATRENALAVQRAQESYQRLRMSIDPVFAAQQRMKQAHDTVREALARETITRQQAAQTLRLYRQRLREAGQSTVVTTDATGRLRAQFLATANTIAILDGPLGGIASRFSAFGVLLGRVGLQLGVAAVGITAAGAAIGTSIRQAVQAETAQLSLEAAVRATGGAAGITAQQIEGLARAIEAETLASRESVRQAATQLLTFESITGDMFERTLRISQDIAQVFGRDITDVAFQVAKALENPAQSLASLERAYGALRPGLRATVIDMMEQGRAAEAMALAMEDLERRFKGFGEDAAAGLAGQIDTLQAAFTDLRDRIFEIVNGSDRVQSAFAAVTTAVVAFTNSLDTLVRIAQAYAAIIGARGAIAVGTRLYTSLTAAATAASFSFAGALAAVRAALIATGVAIPAVALGTLVAYLDRNVNSANRLRRELDDLRDASQENVGTAGKLAGELSRLGTVTTESAQAHLNRANAVRIGIMADIEAMRIAVMSSAEFQKLAEREQRIQRELEQGRFRRGGEERAQGRLAAVQAEIAAMLDGVIDRDAAERLGALTREAANLTRAIAEAEGGVARIGEGGRTFSQDIAQSVDSFVQRVALQDRELELLNEGLTRAEVRRQMEEDLLRAEAEKLTQAADALRGAEDLNEETARQIIALDDAAARALLLAQNLADARDAADFSENLKVSLENLEHQNDVLEMQLQLMDDGLEYTKAIARAEIEVEKARVNTLIQTEGITDELAQQLALLNAMSDAIDVNVELRDRVSARRPSSTRGGGGGAGRDPVDIADTIRKMEIQIDRERQLIGLTRAHRTELEILFRLQDANRDADIQMSQEALENTARRIAAEQEKNAVLEEQQQVMENIARTIENQMERAFMSIVDGTKSAKDAFRDMARAIIAELFRVLVVQQMVGQFSGAINSFVGGLVGGGASASAGVVNAGGLYANGAAFYGGNVVPFATGGVVSRPTTFPMSGGRTGLMGEAGPEAILPLKRGRDGRLGVTVEGSGGTVVNQTFSFNLAANGDESVKRIVAQAAPQIVESAKAGVLDAKRRGGSYGSAFGRG